MLTSLYQNGFFIELYNAQSKDVLKNWKLSGKIEKEYDNNVKGYLHTLTIGGISKMQLPSNDKQSIGLVHNYLLFQLYLISSKSFSIEIAVSDSSNTKRRIILSSSSKETVINSLHCRIPLITFPIGVWVNMTINVGNIISECFKNQSLRVIDSITLSANCKIRKVCSLKNNNEENMPKGLSLPIGMEYYNITLNYDQLDISDLLKEDGLGNNGNNTNTKRYVYCKNVISECKQLRSKSQTKPFNKVPKKQAIKDNEGNEPKESKDSPLKKANHIPYYNKPIKKPTNIQYDNNGRRILSPVNPTQSPSNNIISPIQPEPIKNNNYINPDKASKSNAIQSQIKITYKDTIKLQQSPLNQKFMTTFNLNHDNDDHSHKEPIPCNIGDSIEEIEDFNDINGTLIDESLIKIKNHNEINNYQLQQQQIWGPDNDPIINPFPQLIPDNKEIEDAQNKKEFLDEVFNDMPSMSVLDSNRPFTPPITKLIPIKFKETTINDSKSNKKTNDNSSDVIYDKVLGCYYDPHCNAYFQIKNI